jgi:hypothetical protein
VTAGLAIGIALGGCGADERIGARVALGAAADPPAPSCAGAVLTALGHVAMHVYDEGVSSERAVTAVHFIKTSTRLHAAVERGDARAAQTIAEGLIANGHMTNLEVIRGGKVLVDAGPAALAPLRGTLTGARGTPIGTYVTSVWTDGGFVTETEGIAGSSVALLANGQSIAGSFALPPGALGTEGTLSQSGVDYQYTSFPANTFPSGPLRVYLLRPISSASQFCGRTSQDTVVNTLTRVATLIYDGEAGRRALIQVHRVQKNGPLLRAVARRDPGATRRAVEGLLNQHVVRLRVSAAGRLLSDVGGPFVLAPVNAPLLVGGRTIGSFVLSIQDDEGYRRLAKRLAGLDVLMYMGGRLVKNSLGPNPGRVPANGSYHHRGHTFRVFTLHVEAFPSGPLRIVVLVPIPYT